MAKLYLYNTLSRSREEFLPIKDDQVGLYTCGPTVYNFAHIGNLRTYIFEDLLKRVLLYNGYKVKHVMNITDVGHLTGDMDMGEDKIEIGAKREGKSAWEIAEFYTLAFKDDIRKLNILEPDIWCKATENINEQIELIKKLEVKGCTYRTSDGLYFDTSKFKEYNKLSHLNLDTLKEGARVEKNGEKKNPTDFALWKFSPRRGSGQAPRQMEWDSPWGVGFPGWHIECSAMSMKFLGEQFDLHCGGIDHINIHHTNEIAQAEAATGKVPWVRYWLHGAFLNIAGGKKMAKSEENFLTLENAFTKKGIDPLVYRFAALQTHYRKPMEYSEEGMINAKTGLEHLYNQVRELVGQKTDDRKQTMSGKVDENFKNKFISEINDDLNMPEALAVVQNLLKSDLPKEIKFVTISDFDKVLGLKLKPTILSTKYWSVVSYSDEVGKLLDERKKARLEKNFKESDRLRDEIKKLGYIVEDTKDGQRISKK